LFSTSWAVPNNVLSSSTPSSTSSQTPTPSQKSGNSSNNGRTILIGLAIGGPIVLILACVFVHILVRRCVNMKEDPQPTVIDLKKEFNSDTSTVSGTQGVETVLSSSPTTVYPRQSYYADEIQKMQEGQGPYARERSVNDVERWAQNVPIPNLDDNGRPPSRRFGRERRGSESSIHPPVLIPGVRASTDMGWGRQSIVGGQIRMSRADSPPEDPDFRVSYFYSETPAPQVQGRRPLPHVPPASAAPPERERDRYDPHSTYNWARQSVFDLPQTAPVVRSGGGPSYF